MPISICEYCGKPFNNYTMTLCAECSKIVEEAYVKARRYIYQNSKINDYGTIIEATEIPEKALGYLIKKGRIEVANKTGSGLRCRACGKETTGRALCDHCMSKVVSEKLNIKTEETRKPDDTSDPSKKKIVPRSFGDN